MKNLKLLIIDDDVDLVNMYKTFLEGKSCQVAYAYNGTKGVEQARLFAPDIIVLDVMMEDVGDGFEVARALRTDEKTANIPILMLSSVNHEHGFNLTIGPDDAWNPVDAFVDKPFSANDLWQKINEILEKD